MNLKYSIKIYVKKTVCYLYGIGQFIGRFLLVILDLPFLKQKIS